MASGNQKGEAMSIQAKQERRRDLKNAQRTLMLAIEQLTIAIGANAGEDRVSLWRSVEETERHIQNAAQTLRLLDERGKQ